MGETIRNIFNQMQIKPIDEKKERRIEAEERLEKERERKIYLNKKLYLSGIYKRYAKKVTLTPAQQKIFTQYREALKINVGLMVCGGLGIGKTMFLSQIGIDLIKQNKDVLYCVAADIDYWMFEDKKQIEKIMKSKVLILDDLWWQHQNNAFAIKELIRIIKYRYGNELLTYIGTNQSPIDVPKTDENEQLKDIFLDKSFMEIVLLNWKSKRRRN